MTQIVGAYYKPPDAQDDPLIELDLPLQQLKCKYPDTNIYLGGYFNLGDIHWNEQSVQTAIHNVRN